MHQWLDAEGAGGGLTHSLERGHIICAKVAEPVEFDLAGCDGALQSRHRVLGVRPFRLRANEADVPGPTAGALLSTVAKPRRKIGRLVTY